MKDQHSKTTAYVGKIRKWLHTRGKAKKRPEENMFTLRLICGKDYLWPTTKKINK